jgi:hypothetical protein
MHGVFVMRALHPQLSIAFSRVDLTTARTLAGIATIRSKAPTRILQG